MFLRIKNDSGHYFAIQGHEYRGQGHDMVTPGQCRLPSKKSESSKIVWKKWKIVWKICPEIEFKNDLSLLEMLWMCIEKEKEME